MKIWQSAFRGYLGVILAGYAGLACAFDGLYRVDCQSITAPHVTDQRLPLQTRARAECEKTAHQPDTFIKISRDQQPRTWLIEKDGQPPQRVEEEAIQGHACLMLSSTAALCKIPQHTDVDLSEGREPRIRSKTGMVMRVAAPDGMLLMTADWVAVKTR